MKKIWTEIKAFVKDAWWFFKNHVLETFIVCAIAALIVASCSSKPNEVVTQNVTIISNGVKYTITNVDGVQEVKIVPSE